MNTLALLRNRATTAFLWFLWIQVPFLAAIGYLRGTDWHTGVGLQAFLAMLVLIWHRVSASPASTRYLISVTAMLTPALLVYVLSGDSWQLDGHMYFFAMLAMLVGFCDWKAIVCGTVTVALHHILLNFLYAAAVFPDGGDFLRVVFHAVIVILEASVLIWISYTMEKAFVRSDALIENANNAKTEIEKLASEQDAIRTQSEKQKKAEIIKLANELELSIGSLADQMEKSAEELNDSSSSMNRSITDSKSIADKVSSDTSNMANNVNLIASAAGELKSSIREISQQVHHSKEMSTKANTQTAVTNEKVHGLNNAAQKITQVVELIHKIAEQTNLLALNATIEAARAGDAGKGFAVVAGEVKNLASETAKATAEISEQIESMQEASRETAHAIDAITLTMQNIDEVASHIAAAVEEQAAATEEIARNIDLVSGSTEGINTDIKIVHNSMHKNIDVSERITSQSHKINEQAAKLRGDLATLLQSLR